MKLPRLFLMLAVLAGVASALSAQDQPPPAKDKKEPDAKADNVVARVAKDMQVAEDRLKKADPGDVTRKIQRNIVDGLDELIKQNSQSPNGGGGGGKSASKKKTASQRKNGEFQPGGGMPSDGPQDQQQGPKKSGDDGQEYGKAKGGKQDGPPAGKDKEKSKGKGKDKEGDGKGAGKDEKDDKDHDKGQAKSKDPSDDPGSYGGLASVKPAQPRTNITSELYRNDWGHLPLTKRLEMDAYSKERFMPRYDEALQQYYRTIAEQAQKKDNQP